MTKKPRITDEAKADALLAEVEEAMRPTAPEPRHRLLPARREGRKALRLRRLSAPQARRRAHAHGAAHGIRHTAKAPSTRSRPSRGASRWGRSQVRGSRRGPGRRRWPRSVFGGTTVSVTSSRPSRAGSAEPAGCRRRGCAARRAWRCPSRPGGAPSWRSCRSTCLGLLVDRPAGLVERGRDLVAVLVRVGAGLLDGLRDRQVGLAQEVLGLRGRPSLALAMSLSVTCAVMGCSLVDDARRGGSNGPGCVLFTSTMPRRPRWGLPSGGRWPAGRKQRGPGRALHDDDP